MYFFSESSRESSVCLAEAGAVQVQLPLGLVRALPVCVCVCVSQLLHCQTLASPFEFPQQPFRFPCCLLFSICQVVPEQLRWTFQSSCSCWNFASPEVPVPKGSRIDDKTWPALGSKQQLVLSPPNPIWILQATDRWFSCLTVSRAVRGKAAFSGWSAQIF